LNKNIGMPNVKPMGWLELVELSEDHQPKYIKENFKALTTNNVAIDYKANRVELFPELFR
jgi:hypothetical protein